MLFVKDHAPSMNPFWTTTYLRTYVHTEKTFRLEYFYVKTFVFHSRVSVLERYV